MSLLDLIDKIEELDKDLSDLVRDLENGEYTTSCACSDGDCSCGEVDEYTLRDIVSDIVTTIVYDIVYDAISESDRIGGIEDRVNDLKDQVRDLERGR